MQAVFLDRATLASQLDLSPIEKQVDSLTCYLTTSAGQIIERAKDCDIIITNKVILGEAEFKQLPKLKLICITATGTNNIDLKAARKAGIAVTNVSGYSTQSLSQHLFAYLLSLLNRVESYRKLNQTHPWDQSETFCQIPFTVDELADKKLAIIGYGNLGQAVAKIASAFGMQIIIAERPGATVIRAGRIDFDSAIEQADIVTLHCPLNENTKNLFNAERFAQLKKACIFINTARGPIVDSQALANALKLGQVSHAIIDVLENEPPQANHPLLQKELLDTESPKLTLTHHIAWASLPAQKRLLAGVVENINAFKNGEELNRV